MENLISVIIPVYNVANYIEQCLLSIINQTYTNLEVLLIDDFSNDESVIIIDRFLQKYNGTICFKILKHQYNKGLSAARNTGLDIASGNYIAFIDSDDYIESHYFEYLLKAIKNGKGNIKISACSVYQDDYGIISDFTHPIKPYKETRIIKSNKYAETYLLKKTYYGMWAKLFDASLLKTIRFREGCVNEDVLFIFDFFPIVEKLNIDIIEIPEQLYFYRATNLSSITRKNPLKYNIYHVIANMKYLVNNLKNKESIRIEIYKKYIDSIYNTLKKVVSEKNISKDYYIQLISYIKELNIKDILKYTKKIRRKVFLIFIKYYPKIYWNIVLIKSKLKF